MNLITFISNIMIPLIIFLIIVYGLLKNVNIFDAFVKGAMDGVKVVFSVLPTLIGLLIAVGIMRQSGFLSAISEFMKPLANAINMPVDVIPLALIKMMSSSAATGLLADLFKEFGADSETGYMAALFLCCSETIFYTISVYFMATKDKEHNAVSGGRWVLVGALICTLAGTIASIVLTNLFFV